MDPNNDYADVESFKKLIDKVGWSKALDIITSIDRLHNSDFAVDHKKMYAFSNERTAEIDREIEEEEVRERRKSKQIEA